MNSTKQKRPIYLKQPSTEKTAQVIKKSAFLAACVATQSQKLAPFCPQWSGVVWPESGAILMQVVDTGQKRKTFQIDVTKLINKTCTQYSSVKVMSQNNQYISMILLRFIFIFLFIELDAYPKKLVITCPLH